MLDREQLETFAAIVEHGSFDGAARFLAITRSAVSQRIRALEGSLKAVLLLRERPVRPTADGEILLRHARALRAMEASLLERFRSADSPPPFAPVPIAVPPASLATWFGPVIAAVLARGRVTLEILSGDDACPLERLLRGEVLGCVSSARTPRHDCVAEPLGRMPYRCVATPSFAARYFGNGFTVHALLKAPALVLDRRGSLHVSYLERLFGISIDRYPRSCVPAPAQFVEAILMDAGYGFVPMLQARNLVAEGALVDLTPTGVFEEMLYWHRRAESLALARQIARVVVREGQARLTQPDESDAIQ